MTYEMRRDEALDYFSYCYDGSKSRFRGPRRRIEGNYIAFLGGTDTFGRFIPRPFPALVEDRIGVPCVNFGRVNSGADSYLQDEVVLAAIRQALITVLQVPGAQNFNNRYYSVHPRRNDRFLKATPLLRQTYPDLDLAEVNFTRHLLRLLASGGGERFAQLVVELQRAWVARMSELIRQIDGPVLLLWLADHPPCDPRSASGGSASGGTPDAWRDPLFVTAPMVQALTPQPAANVQVVVSPAALAAGGAGMVFGEAEAAVAAGLLGPAAHVETADALAPMLRAMLAPA
ncbi:DUF6473 family protein [Pseudooceanicola sp.]|uniref:DUF6473 family protein n=1 Tax=Pseudooceanicola sp. TaxID=1914328 RepID=UPI0026098455|nr:DUF6473 family protein [Pseudooceanicola sp.]MDF1854698.1 DUF6473 family protein [Pseudooceanicola sp.]